MNNDYVLDLSQQAIKTTLLLASPMLLGSLIIGIAISIFQAVTQINEQTLAFVPKIVVIFLSMVVAGPWLLQTMTGFTEEIMINIPRLVGQ